MKDTIFKLAKLKKLDEITYEIEKSSKNLEFSIRGKDELGKNYIINFGAGPIEEILKFKKLLDEGIITQEEFDAKKKQLLGL